MSSSAPDPAIPSGLTIRTLTAEDAPRWDAFVRATPAATFFHLSAWQGIIGDVFGHKTFFLYAERNSEIVAVLPLVEVKSLLFGHALTSSPFCVYGGIAAAADAGEAAIAALEAEAEVLASWLGAGHLEYRNLAQRHADWPRQEIYVTFRKEILPEVEANMLAIPRKQRAMVRKGIKNGLVSTVDPDIERFFAVYADNVLRHGTPALPKHFFTRLKSEFGDGCEVLTITDPAGEVLSSVLSFYFRNEVLPYYAGDYVKARDLAANDFKYWELMRRACERGFTLFDYGRSKVGSGPWHFKKNWGFEPQPLSYEYRLYTRRSVPQNNPLNPKYRLFIALWKRLPLRVANAIGPRIVRNLG
ncbi:peptidoglycan bridge formation protein FemAB [Betaproteobacteria bacterium]|nr:peptidoglycan bridge formation protein FemAB [Betaproteobacteria bacterium]GHU18081.1 peptidoglycan bridge formation protein FemAB [Betaproteobacteria bacterium]GHU27504.1 peptidoglycan bridge formation protein FemAB [Betaproteobacteria bacterium]